MTPTGRRYAADLAERIAASFLEGALASTPITFGVADLSHPRQLGLTLLVGGLTGVLALVKGLLARTVGDGDTAALLSVHADTPKPEQPDRWGTDVRARASEVWTKNEPLPEIPVGPHPVAGTGGPLTVHPRPGPTPDPLS